LRLPCSVPKFAWEVDAEYKQVVAFTQMKPGSLISIDTNFCPTTFVGLLFVKIASLFGAPAMQTPEQEQVRSIFNEKVVDIDSTLVSLTTGQQILPTESVIEDTFLADGKLNVKVRYS
jgi:hypothetical protein